MKLFRCNSNNYDGFQHLNFIFPQKLISFMWLDPRTMGVFHFSLATIHSCSLSNITFPKQHNYHIENNTISTPQPFLNPRK